MDGRMSPKNVNGSGGGEVVELPFARPNMMVNEMKKITEPMSQFETVQISQHSVRPINRLQTNKK